MNSEVYRDIRSAQIQSNAAKLIGQRFTVNEPMTQNMLQSRSFLKVKKVKYSAMVKSVSWFQHDWACISLAEDKTKGRKIHKQQTITEVSCSKGLAKHHKGGNPVSGDVHDFHT